MNIHGSDNDPFEEDISFDDAGLLSSKLSRGRPKNIINGPPTFMLFIRTVCVCIAFIGLGMCMAVNGGPLIRLEFGMGVSPNVAFHIFTAHSVGMLFGGILGSVLFDKYNRQVLMFVGLLWVFASVVVVPFTIPASLGWTFVTTSSLGLGLGFLFTGGNVLCLDLWGRRGGASVQTLHFCLALGSFIAPLFMHPLFMGPFPTEFLNNNTKHLVMSTDFSTQSTPLWRVQRSIHKMADFNLLSEEQIKQLTLPQFSDNSSKPNGDTHTVTGVLPVTEIKNTNATQDGIDGMKTNLENLTTSVTPAIATPIPKPTLIDGSKYPDSKSKWDRNDAVKVAVRPEINVTLDTLKSNGSLVNITNNNSRATSESDYLQKKPMETGESTVSITTEITLKNVSGTITPASTTLSELITTPFVVEEKLTTTNFSSSTSTLIPVTTGTSTSKPKFVDTSADPLLTIGLSDVIKHPQLNEHLNEKVPLGLEPIMVTPEIQDLVESTSTVYPTQQQDNGVFKVLHKLFKPGTYSNRTEEDSKFLEDIALRFGHGVTRIHVAYICVGVFVLLNALVFLVVLCYNPREPRSRQEEGLMNDMKQRPAIVFMALFSIYMFTAEALHGAVHHLLASTSMSLSLTDNGFIGLQIIRDSGVNGPALFWGLVCGVRFFCILSSAFQLKPGKMLMSASVFTAIGTIFLAIGSYGKKDFLWAGIVVLALGLAPIMPTSLLWMAQVMYVSHRMCAFMIVIASFGNSLTHSALTSLLSDTHMYAYVLVVLSSMSLVLLVACVCALRAIGRTHTLTSPVGYHLANQNDEDGLELSPASNELSPPHTRLRMNGDTKDLSFED